ncbi:hypothetical protein [Burkholderia sp. LMU1-1-1.1]|uniref:hypothetical protein n=1 Tax=Burkholderia sp. LMU1-1-1.1 TaxID=3135266 RepID=UPI0034205B4D
MKVPGSLFILVVKMKKPKAPRVPVLEAAFEINLAKILRAAKASSSSLVTLDDGEVRTVVALTETRLAVHLGGRVWMADIVAVPCLNDRVRPLLKCPRAHEGNFQSLYFRGGELACRHCHALRYRSTLASSAADRARLARLKLVDRMGGLPGNAIPERLPKGWRVRYRRLAGRLSTLTSLHHDQMRHWLNRDRS